MRNLPDHNKIETGSICRNDWDCSGRSSGVNLVNQRHEAGPSRDWGFRTWLWRVDDGPLDSVFKDFYKYHKHVNALQCNISDVVLLRDWTYHHDESSKSHGIFPGTGSGTKLGGPDVRPCVILPSTCLQLEDSSKPIGTWSLAAGGPTRSQSGIASGGMIRCWKHWIRQSLQLEVPSTGTPYANVYSGIKPTGVSL